MASHIVATAFRESYQLLDADTEDMTARTLAELEGELAAAEAIVTVARVAPEGTVELCVVRRDDELFMEDVDRLLGVQERYGGEILYGRARVNLAGEPAIAYHVIEPLLDTRRNPYCTHASGCVVLALADSGQGIGQRHVDAVTRRMRERSQTQRALEHEQGSHLRFGRPDRRLPVPAPRPTTASLASAEPPAEGSSNLVVSVSSNTLTGAPMVHVEFLGEEEEEEDSVPSPPSPPPRQRKTKRRDDPGDEVAEGESVPIAQRRKRRACRK